MTDIPEPTATGYQPGNGEGITYVDVEVRPSVGFQTVGMTARLVFPTPRTYTDALPAIEELRAQLEELALDAVDGLVKERTEREGKAKPATPGGYPAPAPQPAAPVTQGALDWKTSQKPGGRGPLRWLPSSQVPTQTLVEGARAFVAEQGLNPDEVVVFDNRTGDRGLEAGGESYSVGAIKARQGTSLEAAMPPGRTYVGNVDFNQDGSPRFYLSKDGEAAARALVIAQKLGGQPVDQGQGDMPF